MDKNIVNIIRDVVVVIVLCVIVAVLFPFINRQRQSQGPEKREGPVVLFNLKGPAAIISKKGTLRVPSSQTNPPKEELPSSLPAQTAAPAASAAKKKDTVGLQVKPETVTITLREGKREKESFEIVNSGPKDTTINIYKSDPNMSRDDVDKRFQELKDYRKAKLMEKGADNDLTKAALFNGAPWLLPFPYYAVIKAGESLPIQLTVDARELESGEYKVYALIIGSNDKESAVVPVYVEVEKAPRVKMTKLEVNDGFTSDTKGNQDNIANPGEIIAVTATLKNNGGGSAEDLTVKMTSDDAVHILNNNPSQVPFLDAYGEVKVNFLAEVLPTANPDIPPTVILTVTDKEGTQWEENFYLGDPEKIHYPTGLMKPPSSTPQDNQK